MISPSVLRKGDLVALVAPARKVALAELRTAAEILKSWGLEVLYPEGLFLEDHQFAGSDSDRVKQIQFSLDNTEVKALLCVRGGYGTSRIIDALDFTVFLQKPKWMIGFSDFTVMLNHLYNLGVTSVHAPIALLLHQNIEVQKKMKAILFDSTYSNSFTLPYHSLNQLGVVEGSIIGGNLSVLVNQIGTASFPNLQNGILFIEDLDEYLYHIDRMMVQLDRIGVFKQISGLLIGHMSGMHDNKIPFGKTAYQIIYSIIAKYKLTVAFGFPIGHEENNLPIVVGERMRLHVTSLETRLTKI